MREFISGVVIATLIFYSVYLTEDYGKTEYTAYIVDVVESSFCDGFEDGYCEGWKDARGSFAICPPTPVCPIAEIGKNSYRGGYNTGFKRGWKDANN